MLFCRGAASRIRELVYPLCDLDDVNRVTITLTQPLFNAGESVIAQSGHDTR